MANIKEIAKLAGVSVKTVTRAYKRDAVISPETRERILKIAKENGYRPNRAAGRLAAKTIVIGICYAGTTESFNRELAAGIADAAKKLENSRIRLIPRYVSYLSDEASYISVLDEFADAGVDGIITTYSGTSDRIVQRYAGLREKKTRLVLLNNENRELFDFSVTSNIEMTGKMAAELISVIAPDRSCAGFTGELRNRRHAGIAGHFSCAAAKRGLSLSGVYDLDYLPCPADELLKRLISDGLGSAYITTGNSADIIDALDRADPGRRIRVIASDIFPHTEKALKSGRVCAIIYQNPYKQAKTSLLRLYAMIAEDAVVPPCIMTPPQIILESNIGWYLG
ncbi:transcriptional regulator LacI family [Candidatus Colimorpha enterica]|uniref:Transcriptional regulator LacI family n=1 Tax=Candidatus Colimorpha enterica TaxID=3083063 RepID=R6TUY2_9BACT|nr:transcriptional regulator LacI family [Candidatus Colimorpha enterica]